MASERFVHRTMRKVKEGRKEGRKEDSLGKTTKGRNPVVTCEEGKEVHPSVWATFFEAGPSLNEVEDEAGLKVSVLMQRPSYPIIPLRIK